MNDRTKGPRKTKGTAHAAQAAADLFRPDDLFCVWMLSGLLTYRLCDREYDCEHCELDAALAGRRFEGAAAATGKVSSPHPEFPADREYHPTHGWVSSCDDERVRFGLDAFVAQLLDQVSGVVLPATSTRLQQGHPACWLVDDGEPVPVPAPVTGTVVASNARLHQDPGLVVHAPYDEGWLLELSRDAASAGDHALLTAAEMRERSALQLEELRASETGVRPVDPRLGVTLADGGRLSTDLRRELGTHKYHALLRTFLR